MTDIDEGMKNELRAQVERFYRDIWNRHDKSAIPAVLQEEVTFRGSLGEEERISWAGAAFFTFRDGRVADLWVLGDLKGLEAQLADHSS